MKDFRKFLSQSIGHFVGNKVFFALFLFGMLLLVPFVKLLDLWQVLVAFTLLVLYSLSKNKKLGIATVWFMTAVVLHNLWVFIFIILKFSFGVDLLP